MECPAINFESGRCGNTGFWGEAPNVTLNIPTKKGAEMTPMDAARAALKEVFGYDDFRPGQEAT